jgi:hypothetical protein
MGRKPAPDEAKPAGALASFACPNPDCSHFNRFAAGSLSVVEWAGKRKDIRRLYRSACKRRSTERQGTLPQYTKIPEQTVIRIVKCLGHGCSVEATADIREVDPRTMGRLLEHAGRRAEDFHRLRLDRLPSPPEAVLLDELRGRVSPTPGEEGAPRACSPPLRPGSGLGPRGLGGRRPVRD